MTPDQMITGTNRRHRIRRLNTKGNHMGEKGNMTSSELTSMLAGQGGGAAALVGTAGDTVTTVMTGSGTTVIDTASSLGEKLVDKGIGISGDEARDRIRERRESRAMHADDPSPAPPDDEGTEPPRSAGD